MTVRKLFARRGWGRASRRPKDVPGVGESRVRRGECLGGECTMGRLGEGRNGREQ